MSMTITPPANPLAPSNMNDAVRLAEMMSKGRLVPTHFHGQPGDCLMVIEQAMRWGMSPFAVAQSTSVIQGKLMFEGKLVAAAVHASGVMRGRLAYDYDGAGDARTVTVSGTLTGEGVPRTFSVALKDAKTTNKMWTVQPDQQLAYFGARAWARRHVPEVMLGVYSPEEWPDTEAPTVTVGPTIDVKAEPAAAEPKRTAGDFLNEIESALRQACEMAEDVEAVQAVYSRPDVQKALGNVDEVPGLKNGTLTRLQDMLDAARERTRKPVGNARTAPPAGDFPGDRT